MYGRNDTLYSEHHLKNHNPCAMPSTHLQSSWPYFILKFPIKQELKTLKKVPASKLLCHWWHRLLHNHLYLQRLYLHQFVLVCLSISAFASLNNYHDLYSTAQKAAPPFVVRVSGKFWNKVRIRLHRYNEDKNVPRQRRAQIGEKNVNYSHLTKHFIENS